MKQKRAFTLVELLVTITSGSTLMLLAVGIIHQAMRFSETTRQLENNDRSANRLARQFRDDVHRSDQVTVDSEFSLKLGQDETTLVTYTADANRVVREQIRESERHREVFTFSPNMMVKFASLQSPKRAAAVIERRTELVGVEPRVDRQIIAVVGRFRMHGIAGVPKS